MLVKTINKVKLMRPKNSNRKSLSFYFDKSKTIYQISIYKYTLL